MPAHQANGPGEVASEGQVEYGPGLSEVAEAAERFRGEFANLLQGEAASDPVWESIKVTYAVAPAQAVMAGRKQGVPEALIQQFAFRYLQSEIWNRNYITVANFLKNMNFGTPELVAYFEDLKQKRQEAHREVRTERAEAEQAAAKKRFLELPPASLATVDDLLTALEGASEEVDSIFWSELADNVSTEMGQRLIGMSPMDTVRQRILTEYLDMNADSIKVSLPIRFMSGRKKK